MSFRVSPAIGALLGSENRARILGLLASTQEPKTGYAISKETGLTPSKVYPIVRKLHDAGILRVTMGRPKMVVLADEDLRRFLVRRVRIASSDEWFEPSRVRGRREAFLRLKRLPWKPPVARPNPAAVPNRKEFDRPPEKDRALQRVSRNARPRSPGRNG